MIEVRTPALAKFLPMLGLVPVVPALLDQTSVDTSRTAWALIAVWAVLSGLTALVMVTRPVLAACAAFVVVGAVEIAASAAEVELSFLDLAPVAVCLFLLGALATARATVTTALAIVCATILGTVVNRLTAAPEWQGGVDILAGLLTMLLALVGGVAVRAHRERAETAEEWLRLERATRVMAERAASERERGRILREMHDVVAHSVTLLVLNAETLRARRQELPEWAAAQADDMAVAGRRAAAEMRGLLSRIDADDAAPTAPVPNADDIPLLVEDARQGGTVVEIVEHGPRIEVDVPTGLAIYRVVQEGLSNARRHAPGAPVSVTIEWNREEVAISVANDAHGGRSSTSSGLGLSGIRARVDDLGGQARTVVRDGKHVLEVTIPARRAEVRLG